MIIRLETKTDVVGVRRVNEAAFGRPAEADLVDALRSAGAVIASLVAEVDGVVVGHILFSPAAIVSHSKSGGTPTTVAQTLVPDSTAAGKSRPIAALGPMAVLPAWQGRGIGSQLVPAGLELCRAAGYDLVIVLGHTDYYPRFGFRPAPPLGIRWEHGADAHFMVMELQPGALAGARGIVRYRPEFDGV
jgi:putative acetyltransferase